MKKIIALLLLTHLYGFCSSPKCQTPQASPKHGPIGIPIEMIPSITSKHTSSTALIEIQRENETFQSVKEKISANSTQHFGKFVSSKALHLLYTNKRKFAPYHTGDDNENFLPQKYGKIRCISTE